MWVVSGDVGGVISDLRRISPDGHPSIYQPCPTRYNLGGQEKTSVSFDSSYDQNTQAIHFVKYQF